MLEIQTGKINTFLEHNEKKVFQMDLQNSMWKKLKKS